MSPAAGRAQAHAAEAATGRASIFVSVASYCDPLLGFTLRSAHANAERPERVFFGVVEQAPADAHLPLNAVWERAQVRRVAVDALDSRGPCWARAIAMGLWRGEDWFLQIDSHTWFEPGWDRRLVAWGRALAAERPRHIVSCYPNPFRMVAGQPVAEPVTRRVLAHVVQTPQGFADDHPVLRFEGVAVETAEPLPGFHLGGGCLFAPGGIVEALPYDPYLYFHGEEQAYALRAWTHGWDIVHIPGMPLMHLYTRPGEAASRPLHWSAAQDARRSERSAQLDAAARARLARLLWGDGLPGVYGLGRVRTLAAYADFSGIDYAARRIEPRATKARFGY